MLKPIVKTIMDMAIAFALGLITLFFSQSSIAFPKSGIEVSQMCILVELLEKQNDAKIIKGVVGRRGKNTPKIPNINEITPLKK